jgi:signal transduction histidine kinase
VDLAELSRTAAERFRGGHEGRPLRINATNRLLVIGDATRLGQVLDNLLDNAAKYSSPESEIALEARESDDEVLILVRDHGIGIKSEYLPSLFDRFYRVPEAAGGETRGFGLGLSIVRDLVAAHGGRVWAESAGEGQGSTFCVAIPAAKDANAVTLEPVPHAC